MIERSHLRVARSDDAVPAQSALADRFRTVRATTAALVATLSPEDCAMQSMPDASPAKWHLAHTSWFFETFILARVHGYREFDPAFRMLFNSYYNGVGDKHPRPQRGMLSRPSLDQVLAYRYHVEVAMAPLIESASGEQAALIELGLQHEQQHEELILTDIKHALAQNPLAPAYARCPSPLDRTRASSELSWVRFDEGLVDIGADGTLFAFDNELPRHRCYLQAFELASRPATNADYLAFMADGGYRRPDLWLSEGWDWVVANGIDSPLYWRHARNRRGQWQAFTLHGLQALELAAPVCHVSLFEADAFARWMDARLPTEFEWERAAATTPIAGHFLEEGHRHPRPATGDEGALSQLYGDVWEWTQSSYAPYPGFRTAAGAIGEYNGKFMCNQYVLRGGSCATPRSHIRATYRNFFPAAARWQFSGIRLARDAR